MITTLPTFFDMYFTKEDGRLTPDGYMYNDQLFQTLNEMVVLLNSLSTTAIESGMVTLNGINAPSKTTAEITDLEPDVPAGTLWFNSDLKKLQFKADSGLIETITSS